MFKGLNPQGRLGMPKDIAEVVAMVSGEGSGWVTGQTIRVNGGMA
jgi:3-oxoacyl-[acyl-carrier protein] reductase